MAQQQRPRGRIQGRRPARGVAAMITLAACLALVAGLVGSAPAAIAQADQADGGTPGIGIAVPFVGTEGSILAEITIESVDDPFQDYDPNVSPNRAYHFVLLTITVANTGSRPFAFDPNAIAIQDAEGFLYRPLYLPRTEASLAALPDYLAGDVPPGETVAGALAYQALNGAALGAVVYLPASDRLVVLASLTGATTAPTSGTDTADTSGDTEGTGGTVTSGDAFPPEGTDATPAAGDSDAESAASGLDCILAETWATDAGERLDTVALLVAELETFDRDTADPARLGEIAEEFQTLADDQAASETPPELDAASDGFVDAYEAFSAAFDLVAQAAEDGDIDAVAAAANADVAAANTVLTDAAALAQTELAACGLS